MIRPATHDDITRLVELGAMMHAESPVFSRLSFDADKLATMIANVIGHGFAMVAESATVVHGGMLAICTPHWFSQDLVACDLALFIDPRQRGGIAAVRLLNCYEQWAIDQGAKLIQFGIMTGVNTETTEALCMRMGWKRSGVMMNV